MTMLVDPQELDVSMDLKRPPVGSVDRWVRLVVIIALAATLTVLIAGPRVVWNRDGFMIHVPRFWFHNTLAIAFVTTVVLAWLPPARGSRYVRLAILLPIMQTVAMLGTWLAWQLLRAQLPSAVDATPLFTTLPVKLALPGMAIAIGLGARIVARPRKREWLHAVVMLGLVNLLFLGLWLPVSCHVWNGEGWAAWETLDNALASPARMIAYVVVPPFVGALLFTATALRWPQIWRRNTFLIGVLLAIGLSIAIAYRRDVTEIGAFVYVNFIHIIASAALVTVGALIALGAGTWISNARGRRRLRGDHVFTGTIVGHGSVANLELTSWLRGPRPGCAAFSVTTPHGQVPVPAGARVVGATPLSTTVLRGGETVPTLSAGDKVVLGGFIRTGGDGPFRDTSAPIPGADGITVGKVDDERYGFGHVGLDLWRPSIAYLLILAIVSLPGLAGLLSSRF